MHYAAVKRPLFLAVAIAIGAIQTSAQAQSKKDFSTVRFYPAAGPGNFIAVEGANVAGHLTRSGMIKPSGLIAAASLADRHREMLTLLFPPTPPVWIQRLIFPPLVALGRRRDAQSLAR